MLVCRVEKSPVPGVTNYYVRRCDGLPQKGEWATPPRWLMEYIAFRGVIVPVNNEGRKKLDVIVSIGTN